MLDKEVLEDIIHRIVEVADPDRIILFGSAARGEMGRNSDVDLLIIRKGGDSHDLTTKIYRNLHGLGTAIDAIVASPEDVERYKDSHALIYKPALREGRVVYESESDGASPTASLYREEDEGYMNQPGRFPPDDPREWLNRARSNLALARNRIPDAYVEDLCYEAQQAAEKAIKGVLIRADVEFPYTHDLGRLLESFDGTGLDVPGIVRRAGELSRYAYITRYPATVGVVTEEQYETAIAIARAVVEWAEESV